MERLGAATQDAGVTAPYPANLVRSAGDDHDLSRGGTQRREHGQADPMARESYGNSLGPEATEEVPTRSGSGASETRTFLAVSLRGTRTREAAMGVPGALEEETRPARDPSTSIQVFIKTLSGSTVTVEVCPTDHLARLRQVAEQKTGVPADQQRFIFAGKLLREGCALKSQGVAAESTLHLVLRLRGGPAQPNSSATPPKGGPPAAPNGGHQHRRPPARTSIPAPEHPGDLQVARALADSYVAGSLRNGDPVGAGVDVRTRLLDILKVNEPRPLMDVARSLLQILGLSGVFRVEEWSYWEDEGVFRTEGNYVGNGPKTIRIALVNKSWHYVLLDEQAGKGQEPLELQRTDQGSPLFQGIIRLQSADGKEWLAKVVDQGQYPWGDDGVSADPLRAINDALQVSAKSGVRNACAYTHVMYGLFVQHQTPMDDILAAILEAGPQKAGQVGGRGDGEEHAVMGQDTMLVAANDQAKHGARHGEQKEGEAKSLPQVNSVARAGGRVITQDEQVRESESGGRRAGLTSPGSDGPSEQQSPDADEKGAADTDTEEDADSEGVQTEDGTEGEAAQCILPTGRKRPGRDTGKRPTSPQQNPKGGKPRSTPPATISRSQRTDSRARGRGGGRGKGLPRGRGRGRVTTTKARVGTRRPAGDRDDGADGPRRTPVTARVVTKRVSRGRKWRHTNKPFQGYPEADQPPPSGDPSPEYKDEGQDGQEVKTPLAPPGLAGVGGQRGATKQGAASPPRLAVSYKGALGNTDTTTEDKGRVTPPPSPTAIPGDEEWVDEGDRAYAMGPRGDVFDFLNEDHHDYHYQRRNDPLDKALACKIREPDGVLWGWIIAITGRQVTVVYGEDQQASFRKLTEARRTTAKAKETVKTTAKAKETAKATVGTMVPFRRSRTVAKSGRIVNSYAAVRDPGPWMKPDLSQYPILKAVVTVFRTEDMTGRASVGACRRVCPFTLSSEYEGEMPKPGSTFAFTPLKVDGRGHPTIPVIDSAHLTYLAAGDTTEVQLSTDLVPGFYAPGKELQRLVEEKLGITATPFIGKTLSMFNYHADECLVARLSEADGMESAGKFGKQVPTMGSISALMSKQELFARVAQPSAAEVQKAVQKELHHFVIPKKSQLSAFVPYLKKSLRRAQESPVPLKVTVGVFVSQDENECSLYHTLEHYCPFGDLKAFPWTKALTIIDGPTHYLSYNRNVGLFTPAIEPLGGYKLLAVTFESTFRAAGTLPRINEITTHKAECRKLVSRAGEVDVLISLKQNDPRRTLITAKHQGAKYCGGHEDTLVVSLTWGRAKAFLAATAKMASGMYAMARLSLHHRDTYTLVCDRDVVADELYELLGAYAVMPIGGHKYRFCTDLGLLDLAVILHRQNKFIRRGGINKYRTLRDDYDRYVHVGANSPHPRVLSTYHRRLEVLTVARERIPDRYWHRLSNVPRGALPSYALEAMMKQEWWLQTLPDPTLRLTTDTFHPEVWIGTKKDVKLPTQIQLLEHTVIITPGETPPAGAQKLENRNNRATTLTRALQKVAPGPEWEVTKYTTFRGYVRTMMGRSRPRDLPVSYRRENVDTGEATANAGVEEAEPEPGGTMTSRASPSPQVDEETGGRQMVDGDDTHAGFVEVARRKRRPKAVTLKSNAPQQHSGGRGPNLVSEGSGEGGVNGFAVLMQSAIDPDADLSEHMNDQDTTDQVDQNQDQEPQGVNASPDEPCTLTRSEQLQGEANLEIVKPSGMQGGEGGDQDAAAQIIGGEVAKSPPDPGTRPCQGSEQAPDPEPAGRKATRVDGGGDLDDGGQAVVQELKAGQGGLEALESPGSEQQNVKRTARDGVRGRMKEPDSKKAEKKKKRKKRMKKTKKREPEKKKEKKSKRGRKRSGCDGLVNWHRMGFVEAVRDNHKEYETLSHTPDSIVGFDPSTTEERTAAPDTPTEAVRDGSEPQGEQATIESNPQRREAEQSAGLPEEHEQASKRVRGDETEAQLGKKRGRDDDEPVEETARTSIQERSLARRQSLYELIHGPQGRRRKSVTFAQPVAVETRPGTNSQPNTPAVRPGGLRKGGTRTPSLGNSRRRSSMSAPQGVEMRFQRGQDHLQRRNSEPAIVRGPVTEKESTAGNLFI